MDKDRERFTSDILTLNWGEYFAQVGGGLGGLQEEGVHPALCRLRTVIRLKEEREGKKERREKVFIREMRMLPELHRARIINGPPDIYTSYFPGLKLEGEMYRYYYNYFFFLSYSFILSPLFLFHTLTAIKKKVLRCTRACQVFCFVCT